MDHINDITIASQIVELQAKHQALDDAIGQLQTLPCQNQIQLQRLKKQKLAIKDTIAKLRDQMIPNLDA